MRRADPKLSPEYSGKEGTVFTPLLLSGWVDYPVPGAKDQEQQNRPVHPKLQEVEVSATQSTCIINHSLTRC